MAITIRDVAKAAGVSTATVSRALRGLPHVDDITRQKVTEAAERLDYVVSPSASRLATGRAGAIAVITPYIARWYFSKVLSGVESVLQRSDLDLLLFSVGDPSDHLRTPAYRRLRRRVDGILIISLPSQDPNVQGVIDLGLPTSMIGTRLPGYASVTIDDVLGARTATQHLVNLGHERIAVISGRPMPSPYTSEHDRLAGYTMTLESSGLAVDTELITYGYFTIAGGEQAMTALLALPEPPTAVFAHSDEMAFGAMRAMRRQGLEPGRDISIIGFDDHELADITDLTTMSQPVEHLGAVAADALLRQLDHPSGLAAESLVVPTTLIVRGSTRPLRP